MKKLTAVISAAAIAATLALPITAGAAEVLNDTFTNTPESPYTNTAGWMVGSKTVVDQYSENSIKAAITDDGVGLSKPSTNAVMWKMTKALDLSGEYTLSFKLKTGSATPGNFYVDLTGDVGTCQYRLSAATGAYSGKVGTTAMTYTTGSNLYFAMDTVYDVTIDVDASGNYTVNTVGQFKSPGTTATTIRGSFGEGYTKTKSLVFQPNTNDMSTIYIDDVKITTPDIPIETPADANTEQVSAVINGDSVQIGNTTVTDVEANSVIVGDQYISFYKTTVTAGTKSVSGVAIKPEGYTGDAEKVAVNAEAGQTASFYSAVISASKAIANWTYDFTYVD